MVQLESLKTRIQSHHMLLIGGYLDRKPVPLGAIAKSLGISVKLSTLDNGISGMIETNNNGYQIKINRFESRERQRFTLAHEIGHFLLHKDLIDSSGGIRDNVLYRSGQSEIVEFEANKLASELILPSKLFVQDLKNYELPLTEDGIEELADEWQVSKRVINIKMEEIQQNESYSRTVL